MSVEVVVHPDNVTEIDVVVQNAPVLILFVRVSDLHMNPMVVVVG